METIRHRWVYLICAGAIIAGLMLVWHGFGIPVYSNQELASSLKSECWKGDSRPLAEIESALRNLRTARHSFLQGGLSLCLAAGTIAGLFGFFPAAEGRGIRPPEKPILLVRLGGIAAFTFFIADMISADLDYARGDMLECGGPTRFILSMTITIFLFFGPIIVYFIGKFIISKFGDSPASLFDWGNINQTRSLAINLIFGLLIALALYILLENVTSSFFASTPALIIFIYIFLSSRAYFLPNHRE